MTLLKNMNLIKKIFDPEQREYKIYLSTHSHLAKKAQDLLERGQITEEAYRRIIKGPLSFEEFQAMRGLAIKQYKGRWVERRTPEEVAGIIKNYPEFGGSLSKIALEDIPRRPRVGYSPSRSSDPEHHASLSKYEWGKIFKKIILIGNTPDGVASYLAHRFLKIPRDSDLKQYVNVTRLNSSPTIGGDLVGLLRLYAFCDGGIKNRAVIEYKGKVLRESHPDFGYNGPILLSYVDGGIRNSSFLRVELCERSPIVRLYEVGPDDIIVSGIDGGIDRVMEERIRIAIPNASEIIGLYQKGSELKAELDKINNEIPAHNYPKFLEKLFQDTQ